MSNDEHMIQYICQVAQYNVLLGFAEIATINDLELAINYAGEQLRMTCLLSSGGLGCCTSATGCTA